MNRYDIVKLCARLIPENTQRLLDAGCAEAVNTSGYLKKTQNIFAFDFNPIFLVKAHRNYPLIKFTAARSEFPLFKNDSFDVVVLTEVLEHVSDEQKTIDEIFRVLRQYGKVIISVPHKGVFYFLDPDNFKFYFPKIYDFFYKLIKGKKSSKSIRFSRETDFHKHYSVDDLEILLSDKFSINFVFQRSFLLFPLSIWVRYFLYAFGLYNSIFMFITRFIGDVDFTISYGTFSYSLVVIASKR